LIVARAHSDAEVEHLRRYGAVHIVLGELEIAREMASYLDRDPGSPEPPRTPGDDDDGDAFERARRPGSA
jgi:CPA2 family monovalent cation:H+ antiporter-2